jgi:hypothetical protein
MFFLPRGPEKPNDAASRVKAALAPAMVFHVVETIIAIVSLTVSVLDPPLASEQYLRAQGLNPQPTQHQFPVEVKESVRAIIYG